MARRDVPPTRPQRPPRRRINRLRAMHGRRGHDRRPGALRGGRVKFAVSVTYLEEAHKHHRLSARASSPAAADARGARRGPDHHPGLKRGRTVGGFVRAGAGIIGFNHSLALGLVITDY